MPALIESLKGQHAALKSMLLMAKRANSREEHIKLISAAKRKLVEHLALEDGRLYPFLRQEARHDPELKRMLDMFDDDMKAVSGAVETFFVNYEGGWDNDYEFLMDLAELTTRLAHRIDIEEKHLYPEYLARKRNPGRKMERGLLSRLAGLFRKRD